MLVLQKCDRSQDLVAAYGELKAAEEERDRERSERARLRSLLADQQSSATQSLGVRSLASRCVRSDVRSYFCATRIVRSAYSYEYLLYFMYCT